MAESVIACADELFEPGQQGGESRPAADGDEVQAVISVRDEQLYRFL
jgi:hypothetical protein